MCGGHTISSLYVLLSSPDAGETTLQLHITITPPPCRVPRPVQSAASLAPGGAVRGVVSRHGDQAGDRGPLPLFAKYGEAGGRAEDGAASAARV